MVSSVSSSPGVIALQNSAPPPQAAKPAATPQDSVQISSKALAAAGDPDHDGH